MLLSSVGLSGNSSPWNPLVHLCTYSGKEYKKSRYLPLSEWPILFMIACPSKSADLQQIKTIFQLQNDDQLLLSWPAHFRVAGHGGRRCYYCAWAVIDNQGLPQIKVSKIQDTSYHIIAEANSMHLDFWLAQSYQFSRAVWLSCINCKRTSIVEPAPLKRNEK